MHQYRARHDPTHYDQAFLDFDNNSAQDYNDWSIGVSYDLSSVSPLTSGMSIGLTHSDTAASKSVWTDANGEFLGDDTFTGWVSMSF